MEKGIKAVLLFFGLFLMSTLVFFSWLFYYSSTNIEKNALNAADRQISHAKYLLDTEIQAVELTGLSVLSENQLMFFEDDVPLDKKEYSYMESYNAIRNFLLSKAQNTKGIDSIATYWPNSRTLISSKETVIDLDDFYNQLPDEGWMMNQNRLFFVTSYPYEFLFSTEETKKASEDTPTFY